MNARMNSRASHASAAAAISLLAVFPGTPSSRRRLRLILPLRRP